MKEKQKGRNIFMENCELPSSIASVLLHVMQVEY